jgi:branched-chain amino acid transport system substrate-binding protein
MLRTAVLLPRSSLFPSIGVDLLNGIRSCLKEYNIQDEVVILTDNIGYGVEEADIYTKAERFILQENADLVIIVADAKIAEMLHPLFTASNKLLMIVNFGANFPESWNPAPTTLVLSLNFCLHARLTGKMAALQNDNTKAAYAVSYYDAGYRQCYSLLTSHQKIGGIPMFTHVTHLKESEFTLAPLAEFLEQNNEVKTLLCLFCGSMVSQFYQEVLPLQEKFQLQLYGGPMLFDETITSSARPSISGHTPWIPGLDNKHNETFKRSFQQLAGKAANLFAVLGWEAGLFIRNILLQYKTGNNVREILPGLCKQDLESPRGWLKLDPSTFHAYGASWIVSYSNGQEISIIAEAAGVDEEWKAHTSDSLPVDESSGWRNTYLCI